MPRFHSIRRFAAFIVVGHAPAAVLAPTPAAAVAPGATFSERCAQPGVVRCFGFDAASDFNIGAGGTTSGAYGHNHGIFPPSGTYDYSQATQDTSVKASGNSSLRFTVPPNSGSDSSGSFFTNFSTNLSVQFGENSEFFVQWRQRFSSDFLATRFAGGGGWKQIIIGSGDQPGGKWYNSCTALETVLVNGYYRGFAQMYNSCTGSASHGPYDGFQERFGAYDFKLQNARPSPYCLYSQKNSSFFSPTGNCLGYAANEWMTFQVRIKTGPRVGDEFTNSYVTLWIAREGLPSEPAIIWGPYNLSAGSAAEKQKFGKLWLTPYNTGKDASVTNPIAYTWYDELVISRSRIADPL